MWHFLVLHLMHLQTNFLGFPLSWQSVTWTWCRKNQMFYQITYLKYWSKPVQINFIESSIDCRGNTQFIQKQNIWEFLELGIYWWWQVVTLHRFFRVPKIILLVNIPYNTMMCIYNLLYCSTQVKYFARPEYEISSLFSIMRII